jgi:hypothetical protein
VEAVLDADAGPWSLLAEESMIAEDFEGNVDAPRS